MTVAIQHISRNDYILKHIHLVEKIAQKISFSLPKHVNCDDLLHVGMIGLIEAVDRYDEERGIPFKSYAELRIRGAMLDSLRKLDWAPRSVRRIYKEIQKAHRYLSKQYGSPVGYSDVARFLKMEKEEVERILRDATATHILSLSKPLVRDSDTSIGEMVPCQDENPMEEIIQLESCTHLQQGIDQLDHRERMVIELYYYQGLKLREIGEEIGVTESRVCQIRASAIRNLRKKILVLG